MKADISNGQPSGQGSPPSSYAIEILASNESERQHRDYLTHRDRFTHLLTSISEREGESRD